MSQSKKGYSLVCPHVPDIACSVCGAVPTEECCWQGNMEEKRRFQCGAEVTYDPKTETVEATRPCTYSEDYAIKRRKERVAAAALLRTLDEAYVDNDWKREILSKLGFSVELTEPYYDKWR